MSQISSSLGIAPAGAGIQVIGDGNPVHAVGPDGTGLVNLLGTVGDVIVTYNPGAHSVTLSTTGDAANFLTDGIAPNDIAIPVAGTLEILGTANQITTNAPLHDLVHDQVVIGLPDDITINNDLSVNYNLIVNHDVIVLNDLGATNILSTGTTTSTGTLTSLGGITNIGLIDSTGALTIHDATLPCGVMQIRDIDTLYSSTGAQGQLLIARTLNTDNPIWALPNSDGSIVITAGDGTLGLTTGNQIATTFRAKDTTTTQPVAKIITITGDANINSTAVAGSVTMSLNPNITIGGVFQAATVTSTGLMTAGNTFSVTTGNLTVVNGNMNVTCPALGTGFTLDGPMHGNNYIETSSYFNSTNPVAGYYSSAIAGRNALETTLGNIVTTAGTVSGAHLVATTDLTVSTLTTPGILYNTNTGLIQSSNGTPAQVVMAAAGGPQWGNLLAGAGIGLTYTAPNNVTITNTGAGGVKAIFKARPGTNITNATGDGFTYTFNTMLVLFQSLPCFNVGSPSYFQAPVDGYYQFFMSVQMFCYTPGSILSLFAIGRFYINGTEYDTCASQINTGTHQGNFLFFTTAQMTAEDRMTFSLTGTNSPISRNVSILSQYTEISGFQIS